MKVIIIILVILPVFSLSANAEDMYAQAAERFGAYKLEESLTGDEILISGQLITDGTYDASGAVQRVLNNFVGLLKSELRESTEFFIFLVTLALFCALALSMCRNKEIYAFIEIVCCGAAAAALIGGMDGIVQQTTEAMYRLSDYSKAALPVVFSAAAAGGAVSSAAAKYAAVTFSLDILMSISQRLILPLTNYFIALSVAGSMFDNPIIAGMRNFCKWGATTLMTAMTIIFTAYIGMIGAIGSAADAVAVKSARTVISSVLPVIGGMIADVSATLLSAAGVVRNSAGVFGLISVCILCAGPFALLSVKMLVFKAAAAISSSLSNKGLSGLFSSLATAMSLLLGLLGCCGIMLFISLTAGMKAVII